MRTYSIDSLSLSSLLLLLGTTIFLWSVSWFSFIYFLHVYTLLNKSVVTIYHLHSLFYTQNRVLLLPNKNKKSIFWVIFPSENFSWFYHYRILIQYSHISYHKLVVYNYFSYDNDNPISNWFLFFTNFLSSFPKDMHWLFSNLLRNPVIYGNVMNNDLISYHVYILWSILHLFFLP